MKRAEREELLAAIDGEIEWWKENGFERINYHGSKMYIGIISGLKLARNIVARAGAD